MDALKLQRLTRLVTLGILILLGVGLWQTYGAWALDKVLAHGH